MSNKLPFERIIELIMNQETLFEAMVEIKEVNRLNGSNIISDYEIAQIKLHHKNRAETQLREESDPVKYDVYRELQKGYMKLASERVAIIS